MPLRTTSRSSVSKTKAPPAPVVPPSKPLAISLPLIIAGAGAVVVLSILVLSWTSGKKFSRVDKSRGLDAQTLIERVGRHIPVKSDEAPTVATVQDVETLKKQNPTFYRYAQTGDRVLIWSDQAIVYSEEKDLVVGFLPVTFSPGTVETSQTASSTPDSAYSTPSAPVVEKATIEVRNGTTIAGLGKRTVDKIAAAGFEVLPPRDAASRTYATTIIVKIADRELPETIKRLQELFNAEVQILPKNEVGIKGDILLILGADAR